VREGGQRQLEQVAGRALERQDLQASRCTSTYNHVYYSLMTPQSLTVSEARALLPQIVNRVLAGEEITLTRHGQAVAVVIRPDRLRSRRAEAALSRAAEVHEAITAGRSRPIGSISSATAEDLQRAITRSRAPR